MASHTLSFDCSVFDIDFHPHRDFFGVGLVDGSVSLHTYEGVKVLQAAPSPSPLRSVRFTQDGASFVCGSADGTLSVLAVGGEVVWRKAESHGGQGGTGGRTGAPVNVVRPYGTGMVATGDEEGGVRLWDLRAPPTSAPPVVFDKQKDVITSLTMEEGKGTLLATSGDGTLGVYDVRKQRMAARSEEDEEELLSCAIIKGGGAVVTGTQDGPLLVWDWDKWVWGDGDVHGGPEKFTGHPESVDALLALDGDTVVTGSSDGIIRLITIRPNKLVGIVGEHGDDPVERLAFSRDKRILASSSHDDAVRLWDVGYLQDGEEEEEGGEGEEEGGGGKKKSGSKKSGGGGGGGGASRFSSLPALALPKSLQGDDDDEGEDGEEEFGEEEEEEGGGEMEEEGMVAEAKKKKGGRKGKNSLEASRRPTGGGKKGGEGGGGKNGGGMGGFFKDL